MVGEPKIVRKQLILGSRYRTSTQDLQLDKEYRALLSAMSDQGFTIGETDSDGQFESNKINEYEDRALICVRHHPKHPIFVARCVPTGLPVFQIFECGPTDCCVYGSSDAVEFAKKYKEYVANK